MALKSRRIPGTPGAVGSPDSIDVGHPEPGHRIEDAASDLNFSLLPIEGSTSHATDEDGLVRG
jgi:hypothetical protein